jgi:cytochrome c5
MTSRLSAGLATVVVATGLLFAFRALRAAPAGPASSEATGSVAAARENAKLMHSIYASTLDVMHHHYFRINRAVLPARALEEVFTEIESQSKVKAKWIAVNTKAMSITHEPKGDFEKRAAAAIAAGKGELEAVEDGYYRRAAAIPLGAGCVSCHTGFFSGAPKAQPFVGLVISVPVAKK